MSELPVVNFDFNRAVRIYPRPVLKRATLVKVPSIGGTRLPAFIEPDWSSSNRPAVQKFDGPYYAFSGKERYVKYGSAQREWESMHIEIEPGVWVKTGIPQAYQASEPCRVVVHIPTEDGKTIVETSYDLEPGQWVVCQPSGEVQRVEEEKFPNVYHTPDEVEQYGLSRMTDEEFAEWAKEQALTHREASRI